jgi:hypothetical protein
MGNVRFFANTSKLGIFDFKMNFRPIKFASRELTQPFKWGRACAQVPPQAENCDQGREEKQHVYLRRAEKKKNSEGEG